MYIVIDHTFRKRRRDVHAELNEGLRIFIIDAYTVYIYSYIYADEGQIYYCDYR